jgi:hypothetical protein
MVSTLHRVLPTALRTRSFGTYGCERTRAFSVEPTRLEGAPGQGPSFLIKQTLIIHCMHQNNENRSLKLMHTFECKF